MRKLSEITNEDALEVLAELLEPVAELSRDEKLKEVYKEEGRFKAIQYAIKNHKRAVLSALATLDGENPDTYTVNIIQIPLKITELLNDEDMVNFFQSQGLTISDESSGSVTENTGAAEAK